MVGPIPINSEIIVKSLLYLQVFQILIGKISESVEYVKIMAVCLIPLYYLLLKMVRYRNRGR